MKIEEFIILVFVILFVSVAGFFVCQQWNDCKNNGGVLVRGIFLYECVKK